MLAYSKRSVTRATKQSMRLLNAALPCGYDVGSWSVATAKHEDRGWVHAENELFPGIKHRVGRFTLADLVAKHHKIKEYYEANTKEVG